MYELCNGGKLDRANDVMLYARIYLEKLNSNCEEEFFISMKKPLQHIFHSCQIHLLKARFSEKLLSKPEVYIREALKVVYSYFIVVVIVTHSVCYFEHN